MNVITTPMTALAFAATHGPDADRDAAGRALARLVLEERPYTDSPRRQRTPERASAGHPAAA